MRLIDADLFMDFIKAELKQDRPDDMHIHNIIRVLECLPTAYDVDKVVEQLEDELRYISLIEGLNYMEFKEAIDVVKAGGIDDNN